jgi:hypothetical protein
VPWISQYLPSFGNYLLVSFSWGQDLRDFFASQPIVFCENVFAQERTPFLL